MKKIYSINKVMESSWVIQDKKTISQPSFIKTEIIDGEISFEFNVDINPSKLDGISKRISKDFVNKIDKEIGINFSNGVKNKEN